MLTVTQRIGIFVYRNIADLERIMDYAELPDISKASVVGGGLLGLEAAKAVYDMPGVPDVSIIIRQNYPLNRQLDPSAGELVLRKIEAMGVKVLTQCEPQAITTRVDENGDEVFTGFKISDDEVIESDLTIFAIGIKPRDDLAAASGIKCARRGGIDVGDDLMTSEKDIYAIGECASWRGNVSCACSHPLLAAVADPHFFAPLHRPTDLSPRELRWQISSPSTLLVAFAPSAEAGPQLI